MAKLYHFLLPLLSLFFVRVDLTDFLPLKVPVRVLKVYDGDTVLVEHSALRWKLRLSKIDAPEKGQPYLRGRGDAGAFSRACLEVILKGESQLLATVEKADIYGRMLGDVNDVSRKLVAGGCVAIYPHAVFESRSELSEYLRLQGNAMRAHLGLWGRGGILQPKLWRRISKRSARRPWHR